MYRMPVTKKRSLPAACLREAHTGRQIRNLLYPVLALWCQYLSLAALVVYALLRALLTPDIPLGRYRGPLELLWPVSYVLLLTSYIADHMRSDRTEAEEGALLEINEDAAEACIAMPYKDPYRTARQKPQEREAQSGAA